MARSDSGFILVKTGITILTVDVLANEFWREVSTLALKFAIKIVYYFNGKILLTYTKI